MKLEDVVAVNLVDHHPQCPVRPSHEMGGADKILDQIWRDLNVF